MRIGLVQINMGGRRPTSPDGSEPPSFGLLPYSVGLLKSYAITHAAEQHEWTLPIYRRLSVAQAADRLEGVDIAAFSIYIWNARLSLAIAAEVKRRSPQTLIVVGGPQVPERPVSARPFLAANPHIDVVCNGEGEAVFTKLLDRAATRDFSDVPGISFLDADGELQVHPKVPRMHDLEDIPSPYTTGVFDDLFAARPDDRWVMIWETNRGCPFSCSFCDWGSAINSKVFRFDMERLKAEIAWMGEKEIAFVWTADANFGVLRRDLELAELVADSYQRTGYPASITVQSTKNATDRAYRIQKLLHQSLNAYGVTLSLQSVSEMTLSSINRANISSESYRELQHRFAAEEVYTYTDLILGLPGETYQSFTEGVSRLITDGQHNHIQFYNCSVLPNAEMGDPDYQARFGMQLVPQVIRNEMDLIDDDEWEVEEYIENVVATSAMPPDDWRRSKVFLWLVNFAYFDRVAQVALLLMHHRYGWPVHEMIEELAAADPAVAPTTARLVAALEEKAVSIQQGGPEYFPIPQAAGMIWPGDMRTLITLVLEDGVDEFYDELRGIYGAMLRRRGVNDDDAILLDEAFTINQAALTLPFRASDQLVALSHNVWDHYQSVLAGAPVPLEEGVFFHRVVRSRPHQHWDTMRSWAAYIQNAQGKDKRQYMSYVWTPAGAPLRRARKAASDEVVGAMQAPTADMLAADPANVGAPAGGSGARAPGAAA